MANGGKIPRFLAVFLLVIGVARVAEIVEGLYFFKIIGCFRRPLQGALYPIAQPFVHLGQRYHKAKLLSCVFANRLNGQSEAYPKPSQLVLFYQSIAQSQLGFNRRALLPFPLGQDTYSAWVE